MFYHVKVNKKDYSISDNFHNAQVQMFNYANELIGKNIHTYHCYAENLYNENDFIIAVKVVGKPKNNINIIYRSLGVITITYEKGY